MKLFYESTDHHPTKNRALILSLVICMSFFLAGCDSQKSSSLDHESSIPYPEEIIDGYKIPHLTDGSAQLTFANSYFDNQEEKLAALRAVSLFYPEATFQSGLAALEIAYLQLGADYRVATKQQCYLAISLFNEITVQFKELPAISAKALWYKGWIAAELLSDRNEGISYFYEIVEKYSGAKIHPSSPPPWISIYKETEPRTHKPFLPESTLSWPDMAHLEIIRHSENQQQAATSLFTLHNERPNRFLFVPSFKLYVHKYGLGKTVEKSIRAFIESEASSPLQKENLRSLLTDNEV